MLEAGIRGEQSVAVTSENTAKTMGSGTLDVFATPALVALAEKTCWMSVADALGEGCGTVGTRLELEHSAPTPVGMTVTCESELTAVEGRKLVFKVSLHDEKGPVGGGVHERFIINNAKFAAKAEAKKGVTASPSQSAPLALPAPPKGEPLALWAGWPCIYSGSLSSSITCASAFCWAAVSRRMACSLARNSSKYSAL